MDQQKKNIKNMISFNSPVILMLSLLALVMLLLDMVTGGWVNRMAAVRYTSWGDPFMYIRLLTHTIAHQGINHYAGNFLLILAVGPLVEEKYGSKNLLIMIILTSVIIGMINIIFFRRYMLLGASGVVFMLILLASYTNMKDGKIPLTVILVGVIYIGNEILSGMLYDDNVSRMAHIIGGLLGAGFGVIFNSNSFKRNRFVN